MVCLEHKSCFNHTRAQHLMGSVLFCFLPRRLVSKEMSVANLISLRQNLSGTYLFPLKAQTPQFPQLISWGSRSFRSHLKLRNRFSPGSSNKSISPPTVFLTHSKSLSMSYCVYPVTRIGTFVSSSCGIVSAHSWELAGCPRPGWKSIKQSK
jgi:hypothetical protein